MTLRIGFGWDQHHFKENGTLRLGGVFISDAPQLAGHSDGDAVLHALADAFLSAIGEQDIGYHFPPGDPRWKDAQSDIFVKFALDRLHENGYAPQQVDVTIIAQQPRLKDYLENIRESVAQLCNIPIRDVVIKAKSPEHMGSLGRGEGIQTLVFVSIRTIHDRESNHNG